VFILVDDLGWNGVGPKLGGNNPDLITPAINSLADTGLELRSYYTYKVCAPARASFLTGRFPYKLAAVKTNFAYFWTLEGTNESYTMFPKKLQEAGYYTAMVGKVRQ
jgi:arylsulfatase A-like enzyme